jgi:hypothetical protein
MEGEIEFIDVIANSEMVSSILLELANLKNEALCLIPTAKDLVRPYKLGVIGRHHNRV